MNPTHFDELLEFERRSDIWKYRYRGIPIWHFLRDSYLTSTNPVPIKQRIPNLLPFVVSLLYLVTLRLRKVQRLYFFLDRKDLLDFYKVAEEARPDNRSEVFVHSERSGRIKGGQFRSCDALNVMRFLCRTVAPILAKKKCRSLTASLVNLNLSPELVAKSVRNVIGDYWTIRLLRVFIPSECKVYYAGVGVPGVEKYLNLLNSFEIQHGVIHCFHPSYSKVPKTANTLIVYSRAYLPVLEKIEFFGAVEFVDFKSVFQRQQVKLKYPIVIYTQPLESFQSFISEFLTQVKDAGDVYIKRHPRDYCDYPVKKQKLLDFVHPSEVGRAIVFNSSVIEELLLNGVKVVVLDMEFEGIDIAPYLDIYQSLTDGESEIVRCKSYKELEEKLSGIAY